MTRATGHESSDGEERYRALFEGSQASLADMAARQAQALGRVGRLRSAIVAVLRKNFMELSAQAEANLGRRLSETDDEVLLAYLDAFTAAASRSDQRATIQAIGEAVSALGIPLRGDDPLVWVEQIHRYRQELRRESNRSLGWSEPAAPETSPAPVREHATETAYAAPVEDYWQWDDAPALKQLFADAPPAEPPANAPDPDGPAPTDGPTSLGGLFADIDEPELWDDGAADERWTPSPVKPQAAKPAHPDKQDRPGRSGAKTENGKKTRDRREHPGKRGEHEGRTPVGGGTAGTSAPSSGRRPQPAAGSGDSPVRPAGDGSGGSARGDVGDQGGVPVSAPTHAQDGATGALPADRVAAEQPTGDLGRTGGTVGDPEPGNHGSGTRDSGRHDADTHDVDNRDSGSQATDAPAAASVAAEAPVNTGGENFIGQPFRPELFPPTAAKRKKATRTVRTQAQAPDDGVSLLDAVRPSLAQELDDQTRNALLAAASIPRPVFTRDLVAVGGSVDVVDRWEAECRANVGTSPVRFVVPKSRHRLRGRLVAVERPDAGPTDWWYQCVQRYRAGKLYELGVLLHRIGDEVVSFVLDDHTALFRLNTAKGLLAVLVVLESRTDGDEPVRTHLTELLGRLASERLTLLAVLTASAEQGALDDLVGTVETITRDGGVTFTFPVVAARSWEYADDRGSSAVMVSGS